MKLFDNRTQRIQMASLASCVCNIKPKYRCAYTSVLVLELNKSMPCLASFFDAISGVKNQTKFIPAINCPTSAFEPSIYKQVQMCMHICTWD